MALVAGKAFILNFVSITGTFLLMFFSLATLRLLPLELEVALGKILAALSRYLAASQLLIRQSDLDPIRIDPVNWYGRGNVLYQIGQILTSQDLARQRQKGTESLARLTRIAAS